jgi:predicted transcriptional regulator
MTMPIKDSQVSVRLPAELKDQLETYAQLTGRTKSYVAMEALTDYLSWRTPQIEDLKEAVAAADRGDFASELETAAVFARYASDKAPASKPAPRARRSIPPKRK